jgi:hypothetical protein
MANQSPETPSGGRVKPTREQALRIAERRKAARRWRTRRLRRGVTVLGIAAFLGPFGVIFTQLAAGHDPALSSTQSAATKASGATTAAPAHAATAAQTQTIPTIQTTQTTSPAPVTTQQS